MSLVLTILCALCVALLLHAEHAGWRALKAWAKTLASLCFVGVALAHIVVGTHQSFDMLVLTGLALGVFGDVALLSEKASAFLAGLAAFLAGHLAYVAAFASVAPVSQWSPVVDAGMTLFGISVLVWLWSRLGTMRIPVILYVATICTMVVAAFAVYSRGVPGARLIAAGAGLFAISDIAVARDRFVSQSFANKVWGLPTYYAGQLMLAWTVGGP